MWEVYLHVRLEIVPKPVQNTKLNIGMLLEIINDTKKLCLLDTAV